MRVSMRRRIATSSRRTTALWSADQLASSVDIPGPGTMETKPGLYGALAATGSITPEVSTTSRLSSDVSMTIRLSQDSLGSPRRKRDSSALAWPFRHRPEQVWRLPLRRLNRLHRGVAGQIASAVPLVRKLPPLFHCCWLQVPPERSPIPAPGRPFPASHFSRWRTDEAKPRRPWPSDVWH